MPNRARRTWLPSKSWKGNSKLEKRKPSVLAREHDAELLIDERSGRLVARRLGIGHTGVLGLLVRAKQKGLIPKVLPLVFRARDEMNFFISDAVVEQVRRLADE